MRQFIWICHKTNSLNLVCLYINSQHGEGWRLVKTPYDDGGFSGGTIERPALQRLLADIRERVVDAVVVTRWIG